MICIYRITCLTTAETYVGSTTNKNPRWSGHKNKLRKGKHHSALLQSAWNKYGEDQFEFVVIEKFEECTETDLRIKEQGWIEKLNTHKDGFNCAYPVKQHAPSERMTEAHLTYWNSLNEERKNERIAHLRTVEQQLRATKGKQTEEHKSIKREKAKAQWANPEYDKTREELSDRFKGFHKDPKFWENRALKLKANWQDPEYRERHSSQIAEARKKAVQRKKELWADPEYRAKHIEHMRAMAKKGGRPKRFK